MLSSLAGSLAKFKSTNINPLGESGYYSQIAGAEKCTFELLDQEVKGVKLLAQFNPSKLTIARGSATWTAGGGTGNVPALQYKGASNDTLTVDLLFDASEEKGKSADGGGSIMKLIKSYHALTLRYKFNAPKEPPRPPVIKFSWGSDGLVFAGVIKDMSYDITMFNKKGHPMRATIKITMQGEFMPKSPDPSVILAPSADADAASKAKSETKDGADPMKAINGQ